MSSISPEPFSLESLNHLLESATQVKTSDGCTVYNFSDKGMAEKLSTQLEKIGIVGVLGGKKFVAQHVVGNTDFGIVLTADNIHQVSATISRSTRFVELNPERSRELAGALSAKLTVETIRVIFGYYRNSSHSLHNLAKALAKFAETGDINETIEATSSTAHGGWDQPSTIGKTFEWALDDEIHGGVLQTIKAMEEEGEHGDIVLVLNEIIGFLRGE
jgi:hypothetical protein